jgi:plasmid maintenance system antidote protein VapI
LRHVAGLPAPKTAVRLSEVFIGSAETWLTQQAHYDLARVYADRIKLKRLEVAMDLSS